MSVNQQGMQFLKTLLSWPILKQYTLLHACRIDIY